MDVDDRRGAGDARRRRAQRPSSAARLAEQGVVRSEKQGRRARWHLTDAGRRLLAEGTERIYGFGTGDDRWDGRWLVVLCSVPEDQRAKRHQLRTRLGFAGFGFLAPGRGAVARTWSGRRLPPPCSRDLDLLPGAVVFRAEAGDVVAPDDLLRRAWDLDALAAEYAAFVDGVRGTVPAARRVASPPSSTWSTSWRRFPFIDPEIPARLLPAGWPGRAGQGLFDERHAAWAPGPTPGSTRAEAAAAADLCSTTP